MDDKNAEYTVNLNTLIQYLKGEGVEKDEWFLHSHGHRCSVVC